MCVYDPKSFARRLDVALRARRVGKMHALAVALDIDESALSRWRRGKPISVGNLMRLTAHLRVSIDWLLTGVGSMEVAQGSSDDTWKLEAMSDLACLDPQVRQRVIEIISHLAGMGGPRDR